MHVHVHRYMNNIMHKEVSTTGVLKIILVAGANNSVPVTGLVPTKHVHIYSTVYGTVYRKEQQRPLSLPDTSAKLYIVSRVKIQYACMHIVWHNFTESEAIFAYILLSGNGGASFSYVWRPIHVGAFPT